MGAKKDWGVWDKYRDLQPVSDIAVAFLMDWSAFAYNDTAEVVSWVCRTGSGSWSARLSTWSPTTSAQTQATASGCAAVVDHLEQPRDR